MNVSTVMFTEQISTLSYFTSFFYIVATVGILLGSLAIITIDAGLVRSENMIETLYQKVLAFFVSAVAFAFTGYAFWNVQYYEALQLPDPILSALRDWSLFGNHQNIPAQFIDPNVLPGADMFQVFYAFFICFAGLVAVLIHGGGLERISTKATIIISIVIGAILVPVVTYLTYGSASKLTNEGVHDFVGAYSLYLVAGTWSLIMAWRLGKRYGGHGAPGNVTMVWTGVMLLVVAIPMFVIGCGFVVPELGYFGPSLTTTGLGVVFTNIFLSLAGGAVAGGILFKRSGVWSYVLLGPIVGYISCSALFDIVTAWEALFFGAVGGLLIIPGEKIIRRLNIDEPKVGPLTILPSLFSIIVAGIVGADIKQGGVFGVTEGPYTFQHASISLSKQLEGVAVIVIITAVIAFITVYCIEKTVKLRKNEPGTTLGDSESII